MINYFDSAHRGIERFGNQDIAQNPFSTRRALRRPRGQTPNQDPHLLAGLEQPLDEMTANEARSARHQDSSHPHSSKALGGSWCATANEE
jgi:hypothetical protein